MSFGERPGERAEYHSLVHFVSICQQSSYNADRSRTITCYIRLFRTVLMERNGAVPIRITNLRVSGHICPE